MDSGASSQSGARVAGGLTKVPEIALIFWALKLLTTGMGEAMSDFLGQKSVPLAAFIGMPSAIVNVMVNDPFRALSHPIRRGIVERLAVGPATVGEATGGFGVSKPAITKHLRILEETGVVTRAVEGRTHRLSLEPEVLSVAADWMDHQRALWERLFDVVDEYLKEETPK